MSVEPLRIIIAMSGGVDSSVAAALLTEAGHDVIGVMMGLWSDPSCENLCCTSEAMNIARDIAHILNIPFHTIDSKIPFRERVVQYFINSYKSGETPNPCVACNRWFRWNKLFEKGADLGATYVASGHYARIQKDAGGNARLLRGVDPNKDQSYVLHGLSQSQLKNIIYPLGEYTKPQIREIARHYKLPVADRPDSQDLCFVGREGYRDFLVRHAPEIVNPGPIVTTQGKELGQHQGLAFYTTGQRKGLRIAADQPYYVLSKDIGQNALIIGTLDELGRDELIAENLNWISGQAPQQAFRAFVNIRYKARDVWGLVIPLDDGRVQVKFEKPLRDITPGQAAVFYDGEICLGGGIIQKNKE